MPISIFVLIAAGIFALAVLAAFCRRHTVSRVITILLAGICISSIFLFFPRYWEVSHSALGKDELSYPSYPPVLRTVVYTIYYSLKAIGGGQQITVMEDMRFTTEPEYIRILYFGLNYIFFVTAPLLTSSLVLSLIGDIVDRFRCRIYIKRKCHVFSEVNSNTLLMAESIREKYPKDLLVFCKTKDSPKEQLKKLKAMGALTLYASCTAAKFRCRKKQIQFYLVSANEDRNLCDAEELICKYRDRSEGTYAINAFAESGSGIQMVENMEKGNIGVRFVDITALHCSNLLLQYPLHHIPEGQDTISVMIVGCDKTGMRMLKTIAWCGVVEGYRLKIRVYDKKAEFLRKKLSAQCPELMEICDISFISVDAQTSDLEERVLDPHTGSADATYIVMAMGDDEMNIAVAERLSRLFRHHNRYEWMPQILVRIRNAIKADIYKEQENPYLKQRRICPFGENDDVFTVGTLYHSYLENLAFAADLCYSGLLPEKDPMSMSERELRAYFASAPVRSARNRFLQSEYRRRSSMAAALHIPAKLHSCGILKENEQISTADVAVRFRKELQENPLLLDKLAKNEHHRWNSFMYSEGYIRAKWEDLLSFYPHLETKDNQDILSKRHLCLVDWDQLDEINQKYLDLHPPKQKNFKKSDYDLILGIPDMLLLAKRMEDIAPEDAY